MSEKSLDLSKILKEKKIIVLVLVSIAVGIVVLGPVLGKLQLRIADRYKLTESLEQLEKKLNSLAGIDSILINDRVKKMEAVFPSEKPIVRLMGTLSQLSGQHGLSFGGVSLNPGSLDEEEVKKGKTTSSRELYDLKFGFEVGGSFVDILAFMSDLENTAPLMKIEEVGLSIKTNPLFELTKTIVVANIEVSAFYQPPPKSIGSVSNPVGLLSREQEALLNRLIDFKTFEAVFPVAPTGKIDLFSQPGQTPGVEEESQSQSQVETE